MRILVGYDGSSGSMIAIQLAAAIDWPAGSVVRIVGAAGADGSQPGEAERDAGRDAEHVAGREAGIEQAARAVVDGQPSTATLRAAAAVVARPGIDVQTAIIAGDPADVINEDAAAFGADLLITGSRRRSAVQSLLGWSAAGEIVDRSPCPVLVARSSRLASVLVTTDGSRWSAAATEVVAAWPIFDLARIRVATVTSDGVPTMASERTVDVTAAPLMDAGRDVVTEVLAGRPAEAIVQAARTRGVDLIVIGSRGRTGLGRTLLGSVAGEVLASAPCSVLIVGPRPRRPGPA